MKSINPYLTFNGNCREAMEFYQGCFGGELSFQTIGGSPMSGKMPEKMKDCILHSELQTSYFVIMATDCVPNTGLIKGNSISININCSSENEIKELFEKLSIGGTQTHPLEITFWGALFGGLTDKYSNNWLLNFAENSVTTTAENCKLTHS